MGQHGRRADGCRAPALSAQERPGEALEVVDVEPIGLAGDREWACIHGVDGMVGSAEHPRRWGRLLEIGARWQVDGRASMLIVYVDGAALCAGTAEADAVLSGYRGHPVRLSRDVPPEARLRRLLPDDAGMVPEWMDGVMPGQETVTTVAGEAQRVHR
jgi:uncharacterized protein